MSKEKVFIVLIHKNMLKPKSKTEWEVQEIIECVDQLRPRHYTYASVIGDYLNRKMIMGERYGMTDYSKFEEYVTTKYPQQMKQLNEAYRALQAPEPESESPEVFADSFGNIRTKTVFDLA